MKNDIQTHMMLFMHHNTIDSGTAEMDEVNS